MSIITVDCIDQILTLKNTPVISAGGVETDSIRFTFCDSWDGFGKTAVFCRPDSPARYKSLIVNGEATIPHEVLQSEGLFYFGVHGSAIATDGNGDEYAKVKTSQMIGYRVVRGATVDGSAESERPSDDVYSQLMSAYAEAMGLHPYLEEAKETFDYTEEA